MMLKYIVVLSAYLFAISIFGLITSQNGVRALIYIMCLELILNSVNINFITFSNIFDNRQLNFSVFVIAIAAGEAAIGLAILSSIYRNSTRINQPNLLNKKS